jgi:nucleoside-diphosphate-sugar epimerase
LTNVEGTVNLLRSMRENSVFIFASTKDVYGRFADNYREVPGNLSDRFMPVNRRSNGRS